MDLIAGLSAEHPTPIPVAVAEGYKNEDGYYRTRYIEQPDTVGCMHSDCSSRRWQWDREAGTYKRKFSLAPAKEVWVFLNKYGDDLVYALCGKHSGTLKSLKKRFTYMDYSGYILTTRQPEELLDGGVVRNTIAAARNERAYEQRVQKAKEEAFITQHAPDRLFAALKSSGPDPVPDHRLRTGIARDEYGVHSVVIERTRYTEGQARWLAQRLLDLAATAREENESEYTQAIDKAKAEGFAPAGA